MSERTDALDIEEVCNLLEEGKTQRKVAERFRVDPGELSRWLNNDPQRSARARESRRRAAALWDEMATEVLEEAKDGFGLAKAKELAHHYRWRASKIAPKVYGERTTVAGDPEAPLLQAMTDEQLAARIASLQAKVNGNPG
jgi:transcriptional regulator with XRE-family HTH domain